MVSTFWLVALASVVACDVAGVGVGVGIDDANVHSDQVDGVDDFRSMLGRMLGVALGIYTPVSAELEDSLCRTHGLLVRQGVTEGQLWALHMVDASSKLPSGLLAGNLVQLGNIDQCLAVHHAHPVHGPISGQHCLVSLGVRNALSEILVTDKVIAGGLDGAGLDRVDALLSQARFSDAVSHVGATWSLCVPASCSAAQVQRHLRSALPGLLNARVDEMACTSRETHGAVPWTAGAIFVATLLGVIGISIATGTVYDLLTENATTTHRNQNLVSLSLYTNGRALLKTSTTPTNLAAFNGVRCMSALWSVLLHHFVFVMNAPSTNYRSVVAKSRDWTHLIVANGSLCVDSMLVLSGALLAVNFCTRRERNVGFGLWRYYLDRYVRLTPSYLVALLVTATLISTLSDAPFAQSNARDMVETCNKYGWFGPLYLVNYLDNEHTCMGQVWSTCVDMHLHWLSPLLLFPLWRKPRVGFALLLATFVAGVAVVFHTAYQHSLTVPNLIRVSGSGPYMSKLYFKTHTRATPWLIGVGLGFLLHATKHRKVVLSSKQIALGWLTSLLLLSYAFFGAHAYFQPEVEFDRMASAVFVAVMRPAWALGIAWTLFACERGHGGFVNTFLSWPAWQVPSRLCYAVSYTHINLVVGLPFIAKTPQHYDDFAAMVKYLGLVVISFGLGAVVYLTVEVPAMLLYRLRMGKEPTTQKTEKIY